MGGGGKVGGKIEVLRVENMCEKGTGNRKERETEALAQQETERIMKICREMIQGLRRRVEAALNQKVMKYWVWGDGVV